VALVKEQLPGIQFRFMGAGECLEEVSDSRRAGV
jgi:hypothetical protein